MPQMQACAAAFKCASLGNRETRGRSHQCHEHSVAAEVHPVARILAIRAFFASGAIGLWM